MKRQEKWMQKAFKGKEGALHKQLGVPQSKKLPITFLRQIKQTPLGKKARNPTNIGKRKVTVTGLLKKRATLVVTAHDAR